MILHSLLSSFCRLFDDSDSIAEEDKKFVNSMSSGGKKTMTLRIVVCHISFLKFEYFTQRRGEAEYAEVFLPHKI